MRSLSKHDLAWCLRCCPSPVLSILKERAGKLFLAGGYIRAKVSGEDVNDIDLFAPSADAAEASSRALADSVSNGKVVKSDNAFTVLGLRVPVQVIHRWTFEKPEDAIASFDFTVACAALWRNPSADLWDSACHDAFYEDLSAKRLVYLRPSRNEDAGGSMLRVLKFYQKGYRIPLDSLGSVIARLVSGVNFHVPGMDNEAEVAKVVTGLLREVDPNVDPSHIAHLPSLDVE